MDTVQPEQQHVAHIALMKGSDAVTPGLGDSFGPDQLGWSIPAQPSCDGDGYEESGDVRDEFATELVGLRTLGAQPVSK